MLHPKELSQLVDRKVSEYRELGTSLKDLLPEFEKLSSGNTFVHPRVSYFKGQEGVRQLFDKSLVHSKKGKEIYTVFSERDNLDVLGKEYLIDYVRRRVEKGMWSVVYPSEKTS